METTTKKTGTSAWDRYFHMTERGSNLGTEVRGGIVTFVTMAYIVVLNPLIVGTAKDINGNFPGGGQDIGTSIALVAAATALDSAGRNNHQYGFGDVSIRSLSETNSRSSRH